ncbi:hypothetical protein Mapa_012819 [Marchantia paleacea]|nr:hypothetical protein Mapa_012819 [Marchantia paleacea]
MRPRFSQPALRQPAGSMLSGCRSDEAFFPCIKIRHRFARLVWTGTGGTRPSTPHGVAVLNGLSVCHVLRREGLPLKSELSQSRWCHENQLRTRDPPIGVAQSETCQKVALGRASRRAVDPKDSTRSTILVVSIYQVAESSSRTSLSNPRLSRSTWIRQLEVVSARPKNHAVVTCLGQLGHSLRRLGQ